MCLYLKKTCPKVNRYYTYQFQASEGHVAHLLIQDKYRVYSGIGRSDRATVHKEDDLSVDRFVQILSEVYGIEGVDKSKLDLERFKKSKGKDIAWR